MVWNKKKWEKKFQSFALFLKEQEQPKERVKQFCKICGRSGVPLFYNDDIPVCTNCRDNRVSCLQDAAGILYLVYGNFNQMFEVRFRYPNLFFLETDAGIIEQLDSKRGNYNGLVVSTGQSGCDFTLGIAKNIPSAFLEEIFVFSFSKMYLKEKMEEWGNKNNVLGTPVPFYWNDIYRDPEELMGAVKKSLAYGGKLTVEEPRKKCERAIMICYLYNNGREEQANILKEKLQEYE